VNEFDELLLTSTMCAKAGSGCSRRSENAVP